MGGDRYIETIRNHRQDWMIPGHLGTTGDSSRRAQRRETTVTSRFVTFWGHSFTSGDLHSAGKRKNEAVDVNYNHLLFIVAMTNASWRRAWRR
eukprot:6690136-Prymnesium_polylepis.1